MVWLKCLLSTGCIMIFFLGETSLLQRFFFSITCVALIIVFQLQCFNLCFISFCWVTCVLDGENILEGFWCRRFDHIAKRYVIKNRIIISIYNMTNLWFLFSISSIDEIFQSFHITLISVSVVILFLLLKVDLFFWFCFRIIVTLVNSISSYTISNIKK